jgi:hypothetical protein
MDERTRTMTLAAQTFQEEPQLLQLAEDSQEFAKLQSSARRVTLDRGVGRYVVEGDLLYDEDELRLYALQRETRAKARQLGLGPITPSGRSDALVVVAPNGRILRWRPGKILRYCVLRRSFGDNEYESVCANIAAATADWAATCGVVFEHAEELTRGCGGLTRRNRPRPCLHGAGDRCAGAVHSRRILPDISPTTQAGAHRPVVLRGKPVLRPSRRVEARTRPRAGVPPRAHPQRCSTRMPRRTGLRHN